MNFIKFLLIIVFFIVFFLLIKHYIDLENYQLDQNKVTIPIIESDNKPFKILPPPEDNDNPLENSCTLNNEC
jgi:hypothetical protein|tara:strand:+ start:275 stop:490 length:216 start_codon:yes stop_codon:yes gene_type:complete